MTVSELIEVLKQCKQDDIVILSSDAEGNSYSPLRCWSNNDKYLDGEVGIRELTEECKSNGYGQEDILDCGENAVVLSP